MTGPHEYKEKDWSSLYLLSSRTGRRPLFVLIREAFLEGPVVLRHLVWVCVCDQLERKKHTGASNHKKRLCFTEPSAAAPPSQRGL